MLKKTHIGKYTTAKHMRSVQSVWDRIEQDPDADVQEAMDIAHRADLHNAQAMSAWEHQQMVARMQDKLAQFKINANLGAKLN